MPSLTIPRDIAKPPKCLEHAAAGIVMDWAYGRDLEVAGLPPDLPPDWQQRALRKMGELLGQRRSYVVYLETCIKCGACAEKCPFFLATGDPLNMPVARAELVRRVYRRYFTVRGKMFGEWADGEDLTPTMLARWFTYFYQCAECRRCAMACPYGIDTAEITMLAREVMAACGIAPARIVSTVSRVHETGNNQGLGPEQWKARCASLEREIRTRTGIDVKLPVDSPEAEVLLLAPSADLVTNLDNMIGYAVLFHQLGISWTTSTHCGEAANYGLFLDLPNLRKINARILEAARTLRVRDLMWGESGHGWRAGLWTNRLQAEAGPTPMSFLATPYPYHIFQFASAMIAKGALKVDKSANSEFTVAIHDPCNLARVSSADVLSAVRDVVIYSCSDVREMPSSIAGANTICCGGGGGLMAEETRPLRMQAARPRCVAAEKVGANFVAAPCEICKEQLTEAMGHWQIRAVTGGVMELLGRAMLGARGVGPFSLRSRKAPTGTGG